MSCMGLNLIPSFDNRSALLVGRQDLLIRHRRNRLRIVKRARIFFISVRTFLQKLLYLVDILRLFHSAIVLDGLWAQTVLKVLGLRLLRLLSL